MLQRSRAKDDKKPAKTKWLPSVASPACLARESRPVLPTAIWIGYLSGRHSRRSSTRAGSVTARRPGRQKTTLRLPLLAQCGNVVCRSWLVAWQPSGRQKDDLSAGDLPIDEESAVLEAERAIPDQQNAAIRCAPLFARLDANDQPTAFFHTGRESDVLYEDAWTHVEHPEASRWLDSYTWAVDELVSAAANGSFRWPLQRCTYDESTVPYRPLRRAFQLLILSANRDLGEGRFELAITRYFCALEIAHDLRRQVQPWISDRSWLDPGSPMIRAPCSNTPSPTGTSH